MHKHKRGASANKLVCAVRYAALCKILILHGIFKRPDILTKMAGLIALLTTYKYVIVFPLGIFEGPIIAVLCGFLATQGLLSWYFAYLVLVFADAVGDWAYYALGRFGYPLIRKWGHYVGITPERIETAPPNFSNNTFKMVAASKL